MIIDRESQTPAPIGNTTTARSLTLVLLFPFLPRRVIQTRPVQSLPTLPFFFFSPSFFLVSCPFVFPLLFCPSFIQPTEADSKGPADPEHFVVVSCISTRVSAQVANLTGSSLIRPKVLGVCYF